jgi:glutamate carboxypeptidase
MKRGDQVAGLAADLESYLEGILPNSLALLRQMVDVNSFTLNAPGVNALGSLVASHFGRLGFEARFAPAANPQLGDHLVMHRLPTGPGPHPTIALVSHLDTVYPAEDERINDFAWRQEGDRIYGPGTVDIKGGTLVMLMTLQALAEIAPSWFERVHWVALMNAAEELLVPDFGQLCRAEVPQSARACLVFEAGAHLAGRFWLVTARKGMLTFRVEVDGRGAHAGSSHREGANAIVQLAHSVGRVAALTDYGRDLTFNIGLIQGGTVLNRVAHRAEARGEARAFEPVVLDEAALRLADLEGDVVVRSFDGDIPCQVRVEVLGRWEAWPPNPGTDRLFRTWQTSASRLGLECIRERRGGLSDGNWLWSHVPTLDGLGPSGANAHCSVRSADGSRDQEYLLRSSLAPKARLDALALLQLINEESEDDSHLSDQGDERR